MYARGIRRLYECKRGARCIRAGVPLKTWRSLQKAVNDWQRPFVPLVAGGRDIDRPLAHTPGTELTDLLVRTTD